MSSHKSMCSEVANLGIVFFNEFINWNIKQSVFDKMIKNAIAVFKATKPEQESHFHQ